VTGWIVRWRALEERFASTSDALDRWERLDALGREPELFEMSAEPAAPVTGEATGGEDVEMGGEPDAS
jgi:hypothetical protein